MTRNPNKKNLGNNSIELNLSKNNISSGVTEIVEISELGHLGDGTAKLQNGENCFIPYTLAGEIVKIRRTKSRYDLIEIQKTSKNRIKPLCQHFTICGGCKVQQLELPTYQSWKRGIVKKALVNQGLNIHVDPLIDAHGLGRRRVTFHTKRDSKDIFAGLMKYRSHEILNIDNCPILVPALSSGINIVRDLARVIPIQSKPTDIQLTASESGIDCNINNFSADGGKLFTKITELANKYNLARVSIDREVIIERNRPVISIGKASVTLPPASFLQATAEGENILSKLILNYVHGAIHIADLYCGIGTFSIRMAKKTKVTAFDNDNLSILALKNATNYAQELKPIMAIERNLSAEPLFPQELKKFDVVVFDPPRSGAKNQAEKLAASDVKKIIAVSCNPSSFASDASILIKGGFTLKQVTPVDQFKFTPHIELVAYFERL
jgi:23S rRNA (uracil1939-C5)-methyltransferase